MLASRVSKKSSMESANLLREYSALQDLQRKTTRRHNFWIDSWLPHEGH
jgi:hypothetical protein